LRSFRFLGFSPIVSSTFGLLLVLLGGEVAVGCRAGVTCSDIFRKQREFSTLHLREASAGFNASNLLKLFIPSNSHDKNLYPQPLFLISEWLGGEGQEYQSKIRKHLEKDSTGLDYWHCTDIGASMSSKQNFRRDRRLSPR
jgi:hypothetical protein